MQTDAEIWLPLTSNSTTYKGMGVKLVIPGLTKTRRSGPPVEVSYLSFPYDPKLCPVCALDLHLHSQIRKLVHRVQEWSETPTALVLDADALHVECTEKVLVYIPAYRCLCTSFHYTFQPVANHC